MTAFNELDTSLSHIGERAGSAWTSANGTDLFRVTDGADLDDLNTHLQCMLRAMGQIANQGVPDGISSDVAWLLTELLSQASAISEELEVPLRSVQRAK
jgi:hypothetical protein